MTVSPFFFVTLDLSMEDFEAFVKPGLHGKAGWDIMQENTKK